MDMRVDQRTIRFERDDEALAEVDDRRADWLEQQLALARLFCRIDRRAAFFPAGCSSIQELASRRGYDGPRARDLCQLGYVLEAEPSLEALLRANQIGFPAACAIGRIYKDPLLLLELPTPDQSGDEWIRWARFERLVDLRRRIRQRVESVRQRRPADQSFSACVTARTVEKIDRCRQVASQKAGVMLTNGQLLDVVSTGYLLENDELERGEPGRALGTRRLPPTAQLPQDRTIPAEVSRALAERSGGLCEFGSCDRPAAETCHLVPHRDGSGREVTDLVRGCRLHHKLFDAGLIRFLAFTQSDDALGAGMPVFLAVERGEILEPKPRPRAGSAAGADEEQPEWLLRALGKRLRSRLLRLSPGGGGAAGPGEPSAGPGEPSAGSGEPSAGSGEPSARPMEGPPKGSSDKPLEDLAVGDARPRHRARPEFACPGPRSRETPNRDAPEGEAQRRDPERPDPGKPDTGKPDTGRREPGRPEPERRAPPARSPPASVRDAPPVSQSAASAVSPKAVSSKAVSSKAVSSKSAPPKSASTDASAGALPDASSGAFPEASSGAFPPMLLMRCRWRHERGDRPG